VGGPRSRVTSGCEANLPAQYPQASEDSRLPSADVDAGRTSDPAGETTQGASSAHGLSPFVRTDLFMKGSAVGKISDRSTFRALGRPTGRAARGPVRVVFVPGSTDAHAAFPQVGYAIGRRCGNAVHRNRLRRRFRAAVREAAGEVSPGSYLFRPSPEAAELPYPELVRSVREVMIAAASSATAGGGKSPR
jgi:ribonuclease P protein component